MVTLEKIRSQLREISYDEARKLFNTEILGGIVICDSDDGFGGRIIVTKDGKAWGFDSKVNHFVPVHVKVGRTSRLEKAD